MRLTAELIHHSGQYLNAINEFHLDLRGNQLIITNRLQDLSNRELNGY